jgi:sterol desaturase/sphingolipid hydroxylase (fatty acid hydroxylase superfamily)
MKPLRSAGATLVYPLVCNPSTPWLPVGVYVPIMVAGVIWNLLGPGPSPWCWIGLPAAGLLLWSFLEYVLHSQAFHRVTTVPVLQSLQQTHLDHHNEPKDTKQLVVRLARSLPVTAVLFAAAWAVLRSGPLAALLMVGVVSGYLAYEVLHYWIHLRGRRRWLLAPLVKHHLYHHYKDPSRCFGVTSPLWDWVFRTGRPASQPVAVPEPAAGPK